MTTLVVGASGATGKRLVEQLLESGQKVKVVVRPTGNIPDHWLSNENITVIERNISETSVDEMSEYLSGCKAVASCLGHNLTWKGTFGKPRKLVTDAVRLLCEAIIKTTPEKAVRFVLMNTAGNSNRDLDEPVSFGQRVVTVLLRLLLPPHPDNEQAADYLRVKIGQKNPYIQWAAVRPDNLTEEENVSDYSVHVSPTSSAIFNPGQTSRIYVAHFMASLILNDSTWNTWKGQMPVIYNDTVKTK